MELAGEGVETVIPEFSEPPLRRATSRARPLAEADEAFFAEIVRGVVADQRDIDAAVKARLASNWRLERLDATLRAMLRAGAWELRTGRTCRSEIVIDEYVELAKAFFDEAEAKFVNAALDGVARDVRRRPDADGRGRRRRRVRDHPASCSRPLAHPERRRGLTGRRGGAAVAARLRPGPDQGRHRRGRPFPARRPAGHGGAASCCG